MISLHLSGKREAAPRPRRSHWPDWVWRRKPKGPRAAVTPAFMVVCFSFFSCFLKYEM